MKNWDKTRVVLIIASLIILCIVFFVQFSAQKKVSNLCSYLDPPIIDVLAFLAGGFLVFEGIYRIFKHKNVSWKRQGTRCVRVIFGLSIVLLHTMQFIHK